MNNTQGPSEAKCLLILALMLLAAPFVLVGFIISASASLVARMFPILALVVMLTACGRPGQIEPLPDQGPAKLRASLEDNHFGCRYLDEVRDFQRLDIGGEYLEVLWGTLFIKQYDGATSRASGQSIQLNACRIYVLSDNTYVIDFQGGSDGDGNYND